MKTYAVKHKDKLIRSKSRSGGIFTAISDQFLNGGVIYGCVLDEKFNAIHIRTEEKSGRDKMRGSKYIQSQMGDCFKQVKKDLDEGRKVLFSGTSCQIAGLSCFLQKGYSNLLSIDIVCHGVPSTKVWHKYLDWISKGKMVKGIDFRNKGKFGWRDHIETIEFEKRKINRQIWTYLFYNHNILRPACYECPYKSIHHPGDITIADYWGIEKACPQYDDNKGVSLVLINTEKGLLNFEKAKNDINYCETRIEDSMQHPLIEPEKMPKDRKQFWKDFEGKSFYYIAKKYGGYVPLWRKAERKVKKIIKNLFVK